MACPRNSPEFAKPLVSLAAKAENAKWYLVAWALVRLHLAFVPNDYVGLCLLARCHYYRNNDRAADLTYRRAIRVDPGLLRAHMGLGQLHYYNAIRLVRECLILPDRAYLFRNELPAEEYNLKDMPSALHCSSADQMVANRNVAIKELEAAADLESDSDVVIRCLDMAASMLCEQSKHRQAVQLYKRILAMDQGMATAHMHLAGCCAEIGWHNRAREEYEWLRAHAPELAEAILPHLRSS